MKVKRKNMTAYELYSVTLQADIKCKNDIWKNRQHSRFPKYLSME